MTISILVCDDLPEERMNLLRKLRHYEIEKDLEFHMETAADGSELLSMWKPDRWDLIFLCIFMPQVDGIKTARQLRKVDDNCEIVFATTSRRHGMEGYEIHALDYLAKPFGQADVDSVMDWFLEKRAEKRRELMVRTPEGEEVVRAKDILYIEKPRPFLCHPRPGTGDQHPGEHRRSGCRVGYLLLPLPQELPAESGPCRGYRASLLPHGQRRQRPHQRGKSQPQQMLKRDLGDEYRDYDPVAAQAKDRPAEERFAAKEFAEFIQQNGLKKAVLHSLRHSSTSLKLKLSGGYMKAVLGDTGHSQSDMVTDVYSHIMDEDRKRLAKKRILSSLLGM